MAIHRKRIRPHQASSRTTLGRLIMDQLAELGEATVGSFFPKQYPAARLWRSLLGRERNYQFRRSTFTTLLVRLRKMGLVERSGTTRKSVWRLTERGKATMHQRENSPIAPPDGIGRIVMFDIPEKERGKRDALRSELVMAGFAQLQKSVWYGERALPEDFLTLIDSLELGPCIHIFSVREQGTIRRIKSRTFNSRS